MSVMRDAPERLPNAPAYPFTPKSNRYVIAGDFFAVPLSDGRFCAGQVLSIPDSESAPDVGTSTKTIVVGLLDWVGVEPPTSTQVAGRAILDWGSCHIMTITELHGGQILGSAPVDTRALPDYLRLSHRWGGTVWLYRNGALIGTATTEQIESLPVMSAWGYRVISVLAESVFVHRRPIVR